MGRISLIASLYGAVALVALLIGAARGNVSMVIRDGSLTIYRIVAAIAVGVLVGLTIVALSRWAVRNFAWAKTLCGEFRSLLGPLNHREILVLAVASSVAEEVLFRGALQSWLGLWPQAVLFALLHVGPGKRFLTWTASAFVLGVAFGYLRVWRGDIVAPIVAHFTINYLNLLYIVVVEKNSTSTTLR